VKPPRILIVLLLLILLTMAAPVRGEQAPAASRVSFGQVVMPSGRILQVEIADTPEAWARGYMFRASISDNEGMVFLMDRADFHSFWMKNCKVPLDILWMDETWRVVHLEQNLPPCAKEPCPSYVPMQASRYVLEVRGGLAGREGLRLGSHIIYTGPPARP